MVRKGCKVFCIGSAKTGTTSLKTVLEELGYRTQDVVESARLIDDWARRDFNSLIDLCRNADAFQDVADAGAGVTRERALAHFDGRLARFKHPRDVVFLTELPRNAMGKVRLDELARIVSEEA